MNIANAIRGKRRIRFTYDGQPRIVEPQALGMDKRGFQALRGYQVSGGADASDSKGWKMYQAARMHDVEVLTETFPYPHPGWRRGDSPFWSIHAEL